MNCPDQVRIAIVGCGARAEYALLPALERVPDARLTLLVDTDAGRRQLLAARFHIDHARDNVEECYDLFDAAIVALPNVLHASACIKLLVHRKAVLVERPAALTVAECDAMINAAEQSDATLAVALMRRFLWAHRLAPFLIHSETLGRVESFDVREGLIYNRPVLSDAAFKKEIAGGGVLIDTGADTLDCLLHWLGDFSEVEYFDDAEGGVEANCLLNLRLRNDVRGVVELSRTRRLRNTAIIHCERGVVEIDLNGNLLKLATHDQPYVLAGLVANLEEPNKSQDDLELVRLQAEDFISAVKNKRKPEVDVESAKASIRLIEACYRGRQPLRLPWVTQELMGSGTV